MGCRRSISWIAASEQFTTARSTHATARGLRRQFRSSRLIRPRSSHTFPRRHHHHNTSENIDDVGKAVAWLGESIVTGGHATVIKHREDPKYLSYWFQAESFRAQKRALATGTKVIDVSARQLMKVKIPVPPLEVQREIVRILDQFTALEAELEAELEARRRQYQHYRDLIRNESTNGQRKIRLGDAVDVLVGFPFKSAQFVDDATQDALVRGDNIGQGFFKSVEFKRWPGGTYSHESYALAVDDIVLAMDRPFIPAGLKWAMVTQEILPARLVQRVARLRSIDKALDQQFLRHVISSDAFVTYVRRVQTGNTVPHLSAKQIADFDFVLPPIGEQERIVGILDNFDALVNDLNIGLPAELAARRKQYEYYRDRLLTFKERAA